MIKTITIKFFNENTKKFVKNKKYELYVDLDAFREYADDWGMHDIDVCFSEPKKTYLTEDDFQFDEIAWSFFVDDTGTHFSHWSDFTEYYSNGIVLVNHIDLMQLWYNFCDDVFPMIELRDEYGTIPFDIGLWQEVEEDD